MKNTLKKLMTALPLMLSILLPARMHAAPAEVDFTFDTGAGVNGAVNSLAVQPDGKVVIGGLFTTAKGLSRNRIARLNADGSADPTFNPGTGADSDVFAVALQPDGKILMVGYFSTINGISRNKIARLNIDGSVDSSFDPGTGADYSVNSVALQTNGMVLIGGAFSTVNGTNRNGIARLNTNGSLDTSFDAGSGSSLGVLSIAVQTDGKIVIGGGFTTINGTNRNSIARLNTNGSLDTSFDPGLGANSLTSVKSVALQTNGMVVIGGSFTTINGTNRGGIARLNTNGSLETTFNPISGASYPGVSVVAVQTDGKILIGGSFTLVNGVTKNRIARLTTTGSNDGTGNFNPGTGANNEVYAIALSSDGKIFVGGFFSAVNDVSRNKIARLETNGSLSTNYDAGTGVNGLVRSVLVQPDGKVLVGGEFTSINGSSRSRIARLQANGGLDSGFDPGAGVTAGVFFPTAISSFALQTDGKIIIGGNFTLVNGTNRNHIARLNTDGGLDTSFNPGTGANGPVSVVAVQTNGMVLIGGGFASVNGTNRGGIARLYDNGSLDTTFNASALGSGATVRTIVLQPDGQILIGGTLGTVNGTNGATVARLNSNGSLDSGFIPAASNPGVYSLALQSDGKILMAGQFTAVNGIGRKNIARLNGNGSLDESVDPGIGANGTVYSIAVYADDKVFLGGQFDTVQAVSRRGVARLEADGSFLDNTFDPGTGVDSWPIYSIAVQPDGKIIVGGSFTSFNGVPRGYLTRLLGDAAALVYGPVRTNNDFVARFLGTPGLGYTLESRTNIASGNWQKFTNQTAPASDLGLGVGVFELRDPIQPPGLKFYRAVYPPY